ncbi:MAG: hypothetical protein CMH56_03585 [Myxococcales bacterium]|nr:hypothetical protein [Myxococcales bacterium]
MLAKYLKILFLLVFLFGCQPVTQGTRADVRAAISGRVVLVDENGLNDLSRVTVELGQGEGSTIPDEDGVFQLSDLEPDVYEVRVIYSGGLTADASESAYQEFNRRVLLQEGGAADIGDVALELGLGTVSGTLDLEVGVDPDTVTVNLERIEDNDKAVRRVGEAAYSESVDDEGSFTVEDVQVGSYTLTITGPGVSSSNGEGACLEVVQVLQHLELREAPSFNVKSTAVRFSAGTDQIIGNDTSSRWLLSGEGITINVLASFAKEQKMWLQGEEEPENYESFQTTQVIEEIPEGETEVFFKFKDHCDYESDINTLTLVRDTTPPQTQIRLNFDHGYTQNNVVPLAIEAFDALSPPIQMQWGVCHEDTVDCVAIDENNPVWVDWTPLTNLTLGETQGRYAVAVQVKDSSNNATAIFSQDVVYDSIAPQNPSVTIGDGSGQIVTPQVNVTLAADGASHMKTGKASGLAGSVWVPFDAHTTVTFSQEDGLKSLYAKFKDAAGNETDEIIATATLDTTGSITGLIVVEEKADASVALVSLLGTNITTTPSTDGQYTMSNVPAGVYTVQVTVPTEAETYVPTQYGVAVEATQTSSLPNLYVELARGNLTGTLEVETLDDSTDYSGVSVEVLDAGQVAITTETGAFAVSGLIAGDYTVRVAKPGYLSQTLSNVSISHQQDTVIERVGEDKLQLIRGTVAGEVFLEGGGDVTTIQVSVPGVPIQSVSEEGSFEVTDLVPGNHTLHLESTTGDYTAHDQPITILGGQTLSLPSVTLNRARGNLVGLVTLEDENNHSGVSVSLSNSEHQFQAVSNGLGAFDLSGIPTGDYQLTLEKNDFVTHTVPTLTINANEDTDVGTVELAIYRGSAYGIAQLDDSEDHTGIKVYFSGADGVAVTLEDGSWDFPDLKPGFYNVFAEYEGYFGPSYAVYVGAGQNIELQGIVMTRKRGTVTGMVFLEGMTAHAGVTLTLLSDLPALNETFQTTSGPDGAYVFSVPVGNYNGIRAEKTHYATTTLTGTITVTDFGVANADATLMLEGVSNSVSGVATLADLPLGPHDGITVRFMGRPGTDTEGESQSADTDASGNFDFDTIVLGDYDVSYTYDADPNREPVTRGVSIGAGLPVELLPAELREFYLVINDNAPVATANTVTVRLGATDAAEYRLSNSEFTDELTGWQAYVSNTVMWDLSTGDGAKTVYAQFKTDTAELTAVLQASIVVDATATVADFTVTPSADWERGDVIHFRVDAAGESDGGVVVTLGVQDPVVTYPDEDNNYYEVAYATELVLHDDGTAGDAVADDGIYELDYTIEGPVDVAQGVAVAIFTDAYGTASTPFTAAFALQAEPQTITVSVDVNVSLGQATVSWETDEPTTGVLKWGLDALYGNEVVMDASATSHEVLLGESTPLSQSTVYHFAIEATDGNGNASETTNQVFSVRPLVPYLPVAMAGDGRVDIRWEAPEQDNIAGYNIRRATVSETGEVGDYVLLNNDGPYRHEALLFTDTDVTNGTAYKYIVSTVDDQEVESLYEVSADPQAEQPEVLDALPAANSGPTYVGGGLPLMTVWTSSHSPIYVDQNITVPENGMLAIAPGTQIIFNDGPDDTYWTLTVRGRLAVYGERGDGFHFGYEEAWLENDNNMVTFNHSHATEDSRWGGIHLHEDSLPGALRGFKGEYLRGHILYRTKMVNAADLDGAPSSADPSHITLRVEGGTLAMIRSVMAHCDGGIKTTVPLLAMGSRFQANKERTVEVADEGVFYATETHFLGNGDGRDGCCTGNMPVLETKGTKAFLSNVVFSRNSASGRSGNSISNSGVIKIDQHGSLTMSHVDLKQNFGPKSTINQAGGISVSDNGVLRWYHSNSDRNHSRTDNDLKSRGVVRMFDVSLNPSRTRTWAPYYGSEYGYFQSWNTHLKNVSGTLEVFSSELYAIQSEDTFFQASVFERYGEADRMEHYGTHGMLYNHLLGDVTGVFTDLTALSTFRHNSVLTDDTAADMAISEQSFLLNVSEFDEGVLDVTDTFWGYNVTEMLDDSGITEPLDDLVDHPLIYDYREDGLMARSNYGPWAPNAYPLPKVFGPAVVSAARGLTGFEMTASAVDPEDGALSGTAFFWVVNGDVESGLSGESVLVSGLAVGMHTFELWATDSSGQTAKTEYDVEVVDEPGDFIWPDDPHGWYASELIFDTKPFLGPGRATQDTTAHFDFQCRTTACDFACTLDAEPIACDGQLTLTNLEVGLHRLEVQALSNDGASVASPSTFEWRVSDVKICEGWWFDDELWPFVPPLNHGDYLIENENPNTVGVSVQCNDCNDNHRLDYHFSKDGGLMRKIGHCKGVRLRMSGDTSAAPELKWAKSSSAGSVQPNSTPLTFEWSAVYDAAYNLQTYLGDLTDNEQWSYESCGGNSCSRDTLYFYPKVTDDFTLLSIEFYELP